MQIVPKFSDNIVNSFKTTNGRIVKDGGGVTPDIIIETSNRTDETKKLLNSFLEIDRPSFFALVLFFLFFVTQFKIDRLKDGLIYANLSGIKIPVFVLMKALGLDKDDGVVRRRMTQKLELMSDDIAGITIPSDEDLQNFIENHPELFRIEPQVAFSQIYIDVAKRGLAADTEAERLLALLSNTESKPDLDTVGDSLMLPGTFKLVPVSEIAKTFGEKFSLELITCTEGQWIGPIQSGYGLHLVLVTDRIAGRLPELEEVRETVEWEWNSDHKKMVRENTYKNLREKYTIEFEEPATSADSIQAVSVAQAVQEKKQ